MNIVAKNLSDYHFTQVVFFRSVGSGMFIAPYMLAKGITMWGNTPKFLFMRSILGAVSLSAFFFALHRIPVGSAISIRYIGPIFGAVLAMIWLKERVTKGQWISFAIAFAGVIIIKGFDIRIDTLSFLAILLSALTVGGVFVLIKYLSSREHVLTIINHFMITGALLSLLFISQWKWPVQEDYLLIFGIGIFGLFGQLLMTTAFTLEKASTLAPFKYMELVYALIIGYFLLGESYDFVPLVGMTMIILGMVVNVYFKNDQPKEHATQR